MHAWLLRVWNDEEAFKTLMRRIGGYLVAAFALAGPQFVDSKLLWYASPFLAAAGLSVPSKPIAPKPPTP